jgi:hypothetical protein
MVGAKYSCYRAVATPGIILSLGTILTTNANMFIDLRFSDRSSTESDYF